MKQIIETNDAELEREAAIIEAMSLRPNYLVMSAEEDRWEHYQSQSAAPLPEGLSEVHPVYISYTRKRRFKRLHLLQGCWRGPGHVKRDSTTADACKANDRGQTNTLDPQL